MLLWSLLIPLSYGPSLLLGRHPPATGPMVVLAFALALVVAGAFTRSRALDRVEPLLSRFATPLLTIVIAAYVALSIAGFQHRLAHFWPMTMSGLFGQSYWTELHGHVFANSQETIDGTLGSHFGIHFSPTLLIVTPFYSFWPHPATLLAAQAIAMALSVIPLFHILRPRAGRGAAVVFAVALLGVPIFTWAGSGDFRDASFLPALALAAFWALENRRWIWLVAFVLPLLGVREDMGLVVAALGLIALVRRMGGRVAAALILGGLLWFAVIPRFVIPRFSTASMIIDPRGFFAAMFGQWGPTPLKAAIAIVSHPGSTMRWLVGADARYWIGLLQPLLVIPPFLDWAALAAAPGLLVNSFSNYVFMRAADQPYSMIPFTFLSLAAMRAAARPAERAGSDRRPAAGLGMALIVLLGVLPSVVITAPRLEWRTPPAAAARAVVRAVPAQVPIYAPLVLYPWLCNRDEFDSWESTGAHAIDRAFRRRYAWIVLWPEADPAGSPRDRAMLDSLSHDSSFVPQSGFEPFVVFRRR